MASAATSFPAPPTALRILLLGAGGREHALAHRLAQSARVAAVWVAPGNGGTGAMGGKVVNVPAEEVAWGGKEGYEALVKWAREKRVDLVVPGPEQPLVDGAEAVFRKGAWRARPKGFLAPS